MSAVLYISAGSCTVLNVLYIMHLFTHNVQLMVSEQESHQVYLPNCVSVNFSL